jgi:hypothetical protein
VDKPLAEKIGLGKQIEFCILHMYCPLWFLLFFVCFAIIKYLRLVFLQRKEVYLGQNSGKSKQYGILTNGEGPLAGSQCGM